MLEGQIRELRSNDISDFMIAEVEALLVKLDDEIELPRLLPTDEGGVILCWETPGGEITVDLSKNKFKLSIVGPTTIEPRVDSIMKCLTFLYPRISTPKLVR